MCKKCYITTPIYYASGTVHIGNSYSTVACDAFARFHRLKGDDTFFLTGMDEHGLKIEEAAKRENMTPQDFVDKIALETKTLWKNLNITNNDFIRTSEERHTKVVQKIFEQLLANDDIYLSEYEGDYCVACESFFTKTQLNEEGTCPDCGKPTRKVKEESYFLRLKKYQDQLLDFIKSHPDFIQPESRRNEVIAFIEQGLDDLCVSRTSFKWGIPVLSNPKHVIYVWIDALANYITALGYGTDDDSLYQKYWINDDQVYHVIGKDILRFHAIYWPIMLMALNIPIKFKLLSHGWILLKDSKMSKSKGNIVYPMTIVDNYGLDSLRYYLLKEMPFGNDGLFTWERFIERYNVELANDFGNLVSRSISMINKYFGGKVVKPNKAYNEFDESLEEVIKEAVTSSIASYEKFELQQAITETWTIIRRANKYIDETTPWVLAKDESKKEELNSVMYHLYEALRIASVLLSPIMPSSCDIVLNELNVEENNRSIDSLVYGMTKVGIVTREPIVLFKRLDAKKELEKY